MAMPLMSLLWVVKVVVTEDRTLGYDEGSEFGVILDSVVDVGELRVVVT